jgi:hypothetical protein
MRRLTITAALLVAGAGCASMRGTSIGESIVVNAVNENFYDARIHAQYDGGQRRSLGTIAGNGGRSRTVIAWEPRSLVFVIVLLTEGSTYVSQAVDVPAGDSIDVRVPANISESGFFRRVSGQD